MTKRFIALFCSILIIMLPVALAAEADMEEFDEQDTGESIIVVVKSYEPAILKSNILEDDDIDVYVHLGGYTPGSVLSSFAKFEQQKDEPFYSQPEIKQVKVRPLNSDTEDLISSIGHIKPLKYTLEDLETLVIRLKQIPAEKDMPENITLDLSAEIYFENAERLFSLIQQDLIIPEDKDEAIWKEEKNPEEYSFFSGRGFIRATEITQDQATFTVYETKGFKEQPSGIFSTIAIAVKQFVQTRTVTLNAGETSDYMRFSELSFVPENAFRIKLNSIKDPQQEKARARVSVDGKLQDLILYEGMPLFSGSSYKVARINEISDPSGQKRYELTVQGPLGAFTATKTFTSKENKVLLNKVYIGEPKTIQPFRLSELQTKMGSYFTGPVKFDVSTLYSLDITNQFQIEKDMTLAQVLEAILPAKYIAAEENNGITIKFTEDVFSKDVCDGRVAVLNNEADIKATLRENVICTAISEYKELISNYGNEASKSGATYRDLANYRIGMSYHELYKILPNEEKIQAGELATQYLEKAVTSSALEQNDGAQSKARETLSDIKKDLEQDAQYKPVTFEDNGREISLQLKEVIQTPVNLRPQTKIRVEEKPSEIKGKGDSVIIKDDYAWRIKSLSTNDVTLEKTALTNTNIRAEEKTIRVKTPTKVDGVTINVLEINLHKQAYVSIIPGTGKPLMSKTNFTLHIPIEKRTIPLLPETIDQQLNQTQHWIDELDKITTQLESVVQTWNTVCLATFAFLTIKNSFFMGFSRTQARKDVLYGTDGASGWASFCSTNSGTGRLYSSYDGCLSANEGKIETQIDDTQDAKSKLDEEMADYQNQPWYQELTKDYEQIDKYGNYAGGFFTEEELRTYRYNQLLKGTSSYSSLAGQDSGYNLQADIDANALDFSQANTKARTAYNEAVDAMAKYPLANSAEEQQIFNDIYQQKLQSTQTGAISSDEFRELNANTVTVIPLLRKNQDGTAFTNTPDGKISLLQAKVSDYISLLEKKLPIGAGAPTQTGQGIGTGETGPTTTTEGIANEIQRINKKYKNDLNAPLSINQGAVYTDSAGKLYTSIATYDLSQMTTEYKVKTAQFYPDGKPYCIPTSNGNYVKVLDFFADGSPKTVQEWNIGSDGIICNEDDIPIKHESLLNLPENEPEQRSLRSKAARVGAHGDGEIIGIGGQEFTVSTSTAKTDRQLGQASCYDVMDPDDCSTLFGVCDPVMCPASRFNLGGTYQVDNVVQSGIIGSLVLGLHNLGPKEPVPICITGVLAGLKNIQSVLEGYVQCLKEAQATGRSVGICDQIRSIYICDIIYREIVSLFEAKGGMLTWIAKGVFGRDGGEYLDFQNSLQNAQNSVAFFTQSYSRTAFAAFRGRTTEELGTTICSAAIYGKLPELGEMVNQLTKPESPPQFMAKLAVSAHAESATVKKEAYDIFYHIYAGEDKKADYTVFLRNRAGYTYYATEECEGRSAEITAGGIASHNLNCIADSGFDEICVTINGVTECGFGKVTSIFSLNYLNGLIVEDEATKGISSEEDCTPDNQRYDSPIEGILYGGGMLSTGIVRVCSIQNPGQGTNPESWKVIGTCGKDTAGRSIGSCWIDLRTVSIQDTERMANTQRALQEAGLNTTKISSGITYLLDKEASEAELARLAEMKGAQTVALKLELRQAYKALEERSLSLTVAAQAQYAAAEVTYDLSDDALTRTEAPAEIAEGEQESITVPGLTIALKGDCEKCDEGIGACSRDECSKLGSKCVFITRPIPLGTYLLAGIGEIIGDDECHHCDMAKDCSYFNYDVQQCENTQCTSHAGLACDYLSSEEGHICTNKFIETSQPDLGNILPIPRIDNVITSGSMRVDTALIPKIQEAANQLQEGETLKIGSAERTSDEQKDLFIKYITKHPVAIACPSTTAKRLRGICQAEGPTERIEDCEFSFNDLAIIENTKTYEICPHVKGLAIDVYLCNSKKTGSKDDRDACGKLGYENSVRLQNIMCDGGWAGYAPERWHYEYGSKDWKDASETGLCIFGTEAMNRANYHVVSQPE